MATRVLDQFSLSGKTAIVTGGEGLLGKMICLTVRELGGTVWSIDVNPMADSVCDITDAAQVARLASKLQYVDILVNNAVGNQKPVKDAADGWHSDLSIGLTGTVNMMQAFRKHLADTNGVVLNIGSDLALIAPDSSLYPKGTMKPASYSAVKHGIVGLTRFYAALWAPVRVNCLCPGGIDQGQVIPDLPMKRLARLEEMKGPVAFMISEASSYMTGAVVSVDGGRTI